MGGRPTRLSLFSRSAQETDASDEARGQDELEVDDGWAADSDSGYSGEQGETRGLMKMRPGLCFRLVGACRPESSAALVGGQQFRRAILF